MTDRIQSDIELIAYAARRVKGITIGLQTNDLSEARVANELEDIKTIFTDALAVTDRALNAAYAAPVVERLRELHREVLAPVHAFAVEQERVTRLPVNPRPRAVV